MRIAIIGSRNLQVRHLEDYLPSDITCILSGGALGIDQCARRYAEGHAIPYEEYRPDYRRYGKGAPLRRNLAIIQHADRVIAFWDGQSPGTSHTIMKCRELGIPCTVYRLHQPVMTHTEVQAFARLAEPGREPTYPWDDILDSVPDSWPYQRLSEDELYPTEDEE